MEMVTIYIKNLYFIYMLNVVFYMSNGLKFNAPKDKELMI